MISKLPAIWRQGFFVSALSLAFMLLSAPLQGQIVIGVDDIMPGKVAPRDSPKPSGEPYLINYAERGYITIVTPTYIRQVDIVSAQGRVLMRLDGGEGRIIVNTSGLRSGSYVARVIWERGRAELPFVIRRR